MTRAAGARLQAALRQGQRLVSREGDLWRWDGFSAAADAPNPAARRLAERNRLADLETVAAGHAERLRARRVEAQTLSAAHRAAEAAEIASRESVRRARAAADGARDVLAAAERRASEQGTRLALARSAAERADQDREEAADALAEAEGAVRALPPAPAGDALGPLRVDIAARRAAAATLRAAIAGLEREARARTDRLEAIARDEADWRARARRAAERGAELASRLADAAREQAALDDQPARLAARRRALADEIETAGRRVREAADARELAQTARHGADAAARTTTRALSDAREALARAEATRDAAGTALNELLHAQAEAFDLTPGALATALPALAGILPGAATPSIERSEERLSTLRRERERMGGVNLQAEQELAGVEETRGRLAHERDELQEAIRKLRRGIASLNEEGRGRLLGAFGQVNAQFQRLFGILFGGGEAELQLIESEDPLEAGLEIVARPPGKRPQVLTLLSGGEQALAATALIFAVFLTNPSPVCVLDEVDAPLDDANVERLCDLLTDMARSTETRFLVITHNPITMARMDRLFGVTMVERGASRLVSVDLAEAESYAEAG